MPPLSFRRKRNNSQTTTVTKKLPLFQPGDHIKVDCKLYDHHAIFLEWQSLEQCIGMLMQHNGKNNNNGTVERCQEDVRKFQLVTRPKNPTEVLERAQSREGNSGYNLVFSNCEHFCLWCITGKPISTQMMRHTARVAAMSLTGPASVALVATELSWEVLQSIRSYCKGEITAKACARSVATASVSVGGGVAGAAAGAMAGKAVAGRVGAVVGGVVGGAVGQHFSNKLCDKLTKRLILDSRDEALFEAYRVIGVVPTATNEEVNSAYRHKALECHPDKGGKKDEFLQLSTAMELIRVARSLDEQAATA